MAAWKTARGPACHTRGETRVRWRKREDGLEESAQFVREQQITLVAHSTGGAGLGQFQPVGMPLAITRPIKYNLKA